MVPIVNASRKVPRLALSRRTRPDSREKSITKMSNIASARTTNKEVRIPVGRRLGDEARLYVAHVSKAGMRITTYALSWRDRNVLDVVVTAGALK